MTAIPAAGYLGNDSRNQGELKTGLEALIGSLRHVPWSGQVELTATIASGVITPPGDGGVVVIETESFAATDDLTNIVTTNYPDGAFLLLRNAHPARTVVVKHAIGGSGTIQLDRGVDYALDDTKKWLLIRRHNVDWYELLRGPMRPPSGVKTKSATFTIQKEDLGTVFVCTGTYTIALAAAAGLGAGFIATVRNAGTGVLTIDPNSSETVDGSLTRTVLESESVQLVCTGTAWVTTGAHVPARPTVNPVKNGAMEVWQRGTTFAFSISGGSGNNIADRWIIQSFGTTTFTGTINRSTSVPTVAEAGQLYNYSTELDVTTAFPSPAANDALGITCDIHQYIWTQIRRRSFTVSFWVYSSKTGTHGLVARDSTTSCTATYTVNSADTWEYKTVVMGASTSTSLGTYPTQPLCTLHWSLVAGSSAVTSTLGVWQSGWFYGPTGQVNVLDNVANYFRITGVRVTSGVLAAPWDVASFEDDYMRSLQFFQKSFDYGTTPAQSVGTNTGEFIFPSPVGASTQFEFSVPYHSARITGGVTFLYSPNGFSNQVYNRSTGTHCSSTAVVNLGRSHFTIRTTTPTGTAVGHILAIHWHSQ